jgi:small nuclear ribonucleoprotein (snRNP)-like protein
MPPKVASPTAQVAKKQSHPDKVQPPPALRQQQAFAAKMQELMKTLKSAQVQLDEDQGVLQKLEPAPVESQYLKPTRIVASDGRILEGHLACYDGKGNLVLVDVTETLPYTTTDGKPIPVTRKLFVLSVPSKAVVKMEQAHLPDVETVD